MLLVDTNVLLNAVNRSAPYHEDSRTWLESALEGRAPIGFTWVALLGFLRISTRPGVFEEPLTVDRAVGLMREWLDRPAAHLLQPTQRHREILGRLLEEVGTAGNLTTDAHLATVAQEHRATVVTYDSGFSRLGVRTRRPPVAETP